MPFHSLRFLLSITCGECQQIARVLAIHVKIHTCISINKTNKQSNLLYQDLTLYATVYRGGCQQITRVLQHVLISLYSNFPILLFSLLQFPYTMIYLSYQDPISYMYYYPPSLVVGVNKLRESYNVFHVKSHTSQAA